MKEKLAFFGGDKVRKTKMPSRRAMGDMERKKMAEVLPYYDNLGEDPPYDGVFQKEFEKKFAENMGGGYAKAVSTGSVSCYIGIKALNLPPQSEVIFSPVSCSGSMFAVIESGLKPVIVDSMPNSFNSSWEYIRKGISKNTSALFLSHIGGVPLDMEEISYESNKMGLPIVEDCSQAPFARVKMTGKSKIPDVPEKCYVGTYGVTSVFSTMYRKNLQTGGSGGVVFTKDPNIYKQICLYSDRGKPKYKKGYNGRDPGDCEFSGQNFNTDEFSCAIGIASLERINDTIKRRLSFMNILSNLISDLGDYLNHAEYPPGVSPFLLPIILNEKYIDRKEEIAKMINAEGIDLSPRYDCVACQWDIAKKLNVKVIGNENVNKMKAQSFNLFLNENYTEIEARDIYAAFKKVFENIG